MAECLRMGRLLEWTCHARHPGTAHCQSQRTHQGNFHATTYSNSLSRTFPRHLSLPCPTHNRGGCLPFPAQHLVQPQAFAVCRPSWQIPFVSSCLTPSSLLSSPQTFHVSLCDRIARDASRPAFPEPGRRRRRAVPTSWRVVCTPSCICIHTGLLFIKTATKACITNDDTLGSFYPSPSPRFYALSCKAPCIMSIATLLQPFTPSPPRTSTRHIGASFINVRICHRCSIPGFFKASCILPLVFFRTSALSLAPFTSQRQHCRTETASPQRHGRLLQPFSISLPNFISNYPPSPQLHLLVP